MGEGEGAGARAAPREAGAGAREVPREAGVSRPRGGRFEEEELEELLLEALDRELAPFPFSRYG